VTILRQLWETGRSDFTGGVLPDERLPPEPDHWRAQLVCAGQSGRGMHSAPSIATNLSSAPGSPRPCPDQSSVQEAAARTGDVGTYVLFM
jgi:alkanesulfonate monooxygenase SsuD/methylene tetrahydromethanopterin reductase-like flavin-dependent oxidoreductase (luciferase family)